MRSGRLPKSSTQKAQAGQEGEKGGVAGFSQIDLEVQQLCLVFEERIK